MEYENNQINQMEQGWIKKKIRHKEDIINVAREFG